MEVPAEVLGNEVEDLNEKQVAMVSLNITPP